MRFANTVMTIIVLAIPFVLATALLTGGPVAACRAVLTVYGFGIAALMAYSAIVAFTREG